MYFYRAESCSLESSIQTFLNTPAIMECISIGKEHVMDMDSIEEKWSKYGYLLFSFEHDVYRPDISVDNMVYYIMIPFSDHSQLPTQWRQVHEHDQYIHHAIYIDQLTRPFLFLFKKRLEQRLRTRKIIKEYKQEAKRRYMDFARDCEEEILLTLLERVMPIKRGEEIYWLRDYEQSLLEKAIEETKQSIEYKFRPENSIAGSIEKITQLQHC